MQLWYYSAKDAWAISNMTLCAELDDGKHGTYDMSSLIGEGVFAKLANTEVFRSVRSDGFTVVWPCGLDIVPAELYENCIAV